MTEKEGRGTQGRGPAPRAHRCTQESAGDLGSQGRWSPIHAIRTPQSPDTQDFFIVVTAGH